MRGCREHGAQLADLGDSNLRGSQYRSPTSDDLNVERLSSASALVLLVTARPITEVSCSGCFPSVHGAVVSLAKVGSYRLPCIFSPHAFASS